jgi:hypothetical protein
VTSREIAAVREVAAEEAADRPPVRVVVVGDVTATSRRRACMCERSAGGGVTPCSRHTTIGVSQISHSATQQMSSSWYQGVIRAARQRSHVGRRCPGSPVVLTVKQGNIGRTCPSTTNADREAS